MHQDSYKSIRSNSLVGLSQLPPPPVSPGNENLLEDTRMGCFERGAKQPSSDLLACIRLLLSLSADACALLMTSSHFEGGNDGMRRLAQDIRDMGYMWGSYTEAGTTGCDGSKGSSEGYEEKDAQLIFDEWKSEYLMVDSCGIKPRPPPYGYT